MSHSPHAVLATLLVALALTACGGGATATVPVQPPTSLAQTPTTPVPTPTTRSAELTTLNEGLRAAAWANDVTEARRLITLGADVNAKDETQQSAYLIATSEGYLDLLRLTPVSYTHLDVYKRQAPDHANREHGRAPDQNLGRHLAHRGPPRRGGRSG